MCLRLYWALHRGSCAMFHRGLTACQDLRVGIDEAKRRDLVLCVECRWYMGALV